MNSQDIKTALKTVLIPQRIPTFIWGASGVGKTETIRQVAAETGYSLVTKILSLTDPTDLLGYSDIREGKTHLNPPDWLPQTPRTIMFWDEFNTAAPMVQNGMLEFLRMGELGDYRLPPDCVHIAAGNRKLDRAYVTELSSPSKLRFEHIDFDLDALCWIDWGLIHGIIPSLLAWIKMYPDKLYTFDPKQDRTGATPRTLERLSDILKAAPDRSIEFQLAAGAVGEGYATEFLGFHRICQDFPDPERIIAFPQTAPIPDNPNVLYAVCIALSRKADPNNIGNIVQYANRIDSEFSMLLLREARRLSPDVANTKGFIQWAVAHNLTEC